MIEDLIAKARQALATARRDLDSGDPNACANRCYYACFYAAWAMFAAHGLPKPKTHSGLIAEFSKQFVKDGPLDRDTGSTRGKLENLRSYADYTLENTPADKSALALVSAETFVRTVERVVKEDRSTHEEDAEPPSDG